MAIALPQSTDKLNAPDHSVMHRIIAVDPVAAEQSIKVESTGVTTFGQIPKAPAVNPTLADELTRKAYVDALAGGGGSNLVDSFVVAAAESIAAGDTVYFTSDGKVKKGAFPTQDVTYWGAYTSYEGRTFSNDWVRDTVAIPLTSTKFLIAYQKKFKSQGEGNAIIGNITNNVLVTGAFGTSYGFYSGGFDYDGINAAKLDSTNVVVCYADKSDLNNGYCKILQTSGDVISGGSAYEFYDSVLHNVPGIIGLDATKFVICYKGYNNSNWIGRVGSVSGTVISYGVAANFETAAPELDVASWDVDYQASGGLKPDVATPVWERDSDDHASIVGGKLVIDTVGTTACSYHMDGYDPAHYPPPYYFKGEIWMDEVNTETGWTVEVKMKVVTSQDYEDRVILNMMDNETAPNVRWSTVGMRVGSTVVAMDTTDAFHVYRFEMRRFYLNVYVDGVLVYDGAPPYGYYGYASIRFGNSGSSGVGAKTEWEYVKFYVGKSDNPTWSVNYAADVKPPAASPSWVQVGSDYAMLETSGPYDVLKVDTVAPSSTCYYVHNVGGKSWYDSVNNATGWTIEARLKVMTSSTADGRCEIYIKDGTRFTEVMFSTTQVKVTGATEDKTFDMNTYQSFHVYRITGQGATVNVYIDGILRITNTMLTTLDKNLSWGSITGPSIFRIDWFKYYVGGVIAGRINAIPPKAGVSRCSVAALSSTKVVVAYVDTGNSRQGVVRVGTISGTDISFGSKQEFYDNYVAALAICTLASDKVIVVYTGSDYKVWAVAGSVSGDTITWGTALKISPEGSQDDISTFVFNSPRVVKIDSEKFLVSWSQAHEGWSHLNIGKVSGTTITKGNASMFGNSAHNGVGLFSNSCVLDTAHFITAWPNTTSNGRVELYGPNIIVYGFAQEAKVGGETLKVILAGVSPNHSGLTIGQKYYADGVGSVILGSSPRIVGYAVSATKLAIYYLPDTYVAWT